MGKARFTHAEYILLYSIKKHKKMNLEGKNIIISGGSLGIGKETARGLVNKGANVLITGRSENRLIDAKKYTGSKIIEFDISDHKNIDRFVEDCFKEC